MDNDTLVGKRIRLQAMPDDPAPIPAGTEGTVQWVNHVVPGRSGFTQISVQWDNGRTLMLSVPPDRFEVL